MTDLPLQPTLEEFRISAGKGNLVPVWVELTADYETPLSAFEKIGEGAPRFLFESAETTGFSGRYSFMGAHPRRVMTAWGREMKVEERGGEVRRKGNEERRRRGGRGAVPAAAGVINSMGGQPANTMSPPPQ
jgi:anthranilate/para-aminobenzoate synthase component I